MRYRVEVNDQAQSEIVWEEVEAEDLATACLMAGMQLARNRNPVGGVQVLRVRVPAEWMDVKLP